MTETDIGWEDVLRRARRGRRRWALVAAVAVGAVASASAVAVPLLRSGPPTLPRAADRSRAVVALDPRSGVIVEAAPWKGRDGVCYVIVGQTSGCATRSRRGAGFFATPPGGYTFDERVASAVAVQPDGSRVSLAAHRFRSLGVVFFTSARRAAASRIELRDAAGRTTTIFRLRVGRP